MGCNELQRGFARVSAEITAGKDAGKKAAASWAEEGAQAKAYATKTGRREKQLSNKEDKWQLKLQ